MTPFRWPRLFPQSWAIVWLASWIVPRKLRAQWRKTRRAELWHWCSFLGESGRDSQQSRLELSHYCWHAFADALWQRFNREQFLRMLDRRFRSPQLCLAAGAAVVMAVVIGSGLLPITRSVLWPLPYYQSRQIATITHVGTFSPFKSGVPAQWVEAWSQQSETLRGIAEYSWKQTSLSLSAQRHRPARTVLLGQVSPNFFDLLGVGAEVGRTFRPGDEAACAECVVLSHEFWSDYFDQDAAILGRTVALDESTVKIIGVLPARFWFLSQQVSAWSVLPRPSHTTANTTRLAPFPPLLGAVARLRPGVEPARVENELREIAQTVGPPHIERVAVEPIRAHVRRTLYPYLLALLVSVGLVFAMKHFGLADQLRHRSEHGDAVRWWAFFLGKTALLLLAVVLLAMEGTPLISRLFDEPSDAAAWLLSAWICLGLCVGALLWSMRDQRLRCRVCLSRLTLPVFVGDAGRVLFGRGATELVCPDGHGVLHVSEAPCSWIEAEEWTRFDQSWEVLFRDRNPQPPK